MYKILSCSLFLALASTSNTVAAQACTGTGSLSVTVQNCTGTNSPEKTPFILYPNPASGVFWVKSSDKPLEIVLFDLYGKSVVAQKTSPGTDTEILTGDLPAGVYLLRWRASAEQGAVLVRLQ